MAAPGEIRYARADDGVEIAYLVVGDGPRDLVLTFGFTTHLDLCFDMPWFSQWLRRMSRQFRTIVFDKRGSGLSDRPVGLSSIEERTRDVIAVMDAAGSERASLVGISEGGPMSIVCASMYPDRVERLALYATMARIRWAPDYPEGAPPALADAFVDMVSEGWGSGMVIGTHFLQHAADEERLLPQVARYERNACTRSMARQMIRATVEIDVRSLLGSVVAPTLVVATTGDPLIRAAWGRHISEQIPGARYLELPGDYHCSWRYEDADAVIDPMLQFLNEDLESDPVDAPAVEVVGVGRGGAEGTQRILATVLFTDIVGSTERAAAEGDHAWRQLLDRHDSCAIEAIERRGGRLVKSTGDGLLATFDGPSRAIDATREIQTGTTALGLQIRAGVHTGEVERRGADVSGIGVHIAARVSGLAGPGEILATRTVRELTAGSGLTYTDHGEHALKGVPGTWELFAVDRPPGT